MKRGNLRIKQLVSKSVNWKTTQPIYWTIILFNFYALWGLCTSLQHMEKRDHSPTRDAQGLLATEDLTWFQLQGENLPITWLHSPLVRWCQEVFHIRRTFLALLQYSADSFILWFLSNRSVLQSYWIKVDLQCFTHETIQRTSSKMKISEGSILQCILQLFTPLYLQRQ